MMGMYINLSSMTPWNSYSLNPSKDFNFEAILIWNFHKMEYLIGLVVSEILTDKQTKNKQTIIWLALSLFFLRGGEIRPRYFNALGVWGRGIDILLLGCCTRFLCTLIKWCSQLAKITIPPHPPLYSSPSPPIEWGPY